MGCVASSPHNSESAGGKGKGKPKDKPKSESSDDRVELVFIRSSLLSRLRLTLHQVLIGQGESGKCTGHQSFASSRCAH